MAEEIEDRLQEKYENLTIEVRYSKIKTYKIIILIHLFTTKGIKGKKAEFIYKWNDSATFTTNVEQISYNIERQIINFFKKEAK